MAFAAVISLKNFIERLINPTNPNIAQSVNNLLWSFRRTLERLDDSSFRSIDMSNINALDAEIREAAYKLEDLLQSAYLLKLTPLEEINGVKQEIDSILTTLKRLKSEYNKELDNPLLLEEEHDVVSPINKSTVIGLPNQSERVKSKLLDHSVFTGLKKLVSCPLPKEEDVEVVSHVHNSGSNKSTTVGLLNQSEQVKNQLLDGRPGIKTIALVGMAGIGKTHLSLQVYQDPLIVQKFKSRAWVRLGRKYRMGNALADIVAQIRREPINRYIKMSTSKLQEILRRSLYDQRYLIVLDDVWDSDVYSALISEFPPSGKEIRILLTTRLEELAKNHYVHIQHMCFLSNEESWNLLSQNIFGGHAPSPQLEKVGRKIAEKCEGLPLLILAVASILDEHEKTEEYWNKVANNKTSTFPDACDQISKVLSSSYDELPQFLKVCFLYIGVFPQSSKIPLRKLVNLWMAEDFLDLHCFVSLEYFSMICVEKIVSNSLAIVCDRSSSFRIKSLRLHSAYWHMCVKEAKNNKFFHVIKDLTNTSKEDTVGHRRFSVQNNVLLGMQVVYDSMTATSTTRSIFISSIKCVETINCFQHIGLLRQLSSIKCVVVNPRLSCQVVAPPHHLKNFPRYLNKLCLNGLGYDWMHMSFISSLPCLEVLKLRCSAFQGPQWETKDRESPGIRYLLLEDMDLVKWTSKGDCLPSLERLVIRHCYKLKEIPPVIGGIQTLKMEVIDCSPSLVASLHNIQERRNPSLQVDIISSWNLP